MTHEEYVALQRVEIIHTAKNILQGTMDITEGVRFLYNNWREAELLRETTEYLFIIGVEDDLDHIPKGEERKLNAPWEVMEQDYVFSWVLLG